MAERQGLIAERDFAINERACEWTARAISALKARLNLNIKIHHKEVDLLRFSGELLAHSRPAISNWIGLW